VFPIRDNLPTQHPSYITVTLIVLNAIAFLTTGMGSNDFVALEYGFTPKQLTEPAAEFQQGVAKNIVSRIQQQLRANNARITRRDVAELNEMVASQAKAAAAQSPYLKLFTCMFLHGGWMHLIGNMLFLWIFGNNIEDRLGPIIFPVFYLGTGVVATLMHAYFAGDYVPLIGASGAVSGVMGAYFLLHPMARVLAIVPIGYYPMTVSIPAWIYMIFYLVIQNLYPATFSVGSGGVAYWAHIGGFAAGLATIKLLPHRRLRPQPVIDDDDADLVIR